MRKVFWLTKCFWFEFKHCGKTGWSALQDKLTVQYYKFFFHQDLKRNQKFLLMSQVTCVADGFVGWSKEWRSVKTVRRMGRRQQETFLFQPSFARAVSSLICALPLLTKAPATQAVPLVKSGHTVCDLSKCKTFVLWSWMLTVSFMYYFCNIVAIILVNDFVTMKSLL